MTVRRLLTWWAGLLCVVGGCSLFLGSAPCMGVFMAPQHPSLKLKSAKVSPPGPLKSDEEISISATGNKFSQECQVAFVVSINADDMFYIATPGQQTSCSRYELPLHDDGKGGDKKARDGVWYGKCALSSDDDC